MITIHIIIRNNKYSVKSLKLCFIYLAVMVEIVSDEQRSNGHPQFLVGPLNALAPSIPLAQYAQ